MAGAQIMKIEISVPLKFADEVVRDLVGRGGSVANRKETSTTAAISGTVPLVALSDYGANLRSISDGHGTFRMISDYDPAKPSRS